MAFKLEVMIVKCKVWWNEDAIKLWRKKRIHLDCYWRWYYVSSGHLCSDHSSRLILVPHVDTNRIEWQNVILKFNMMVSHSAISFNPNTILYHRLLLPNTGLGRRHNLALFNQFRWIWS